jgi:hypothetical protein
MMLKKALIKSLYALETGKRTAKNLVKKFGEIRSLPWGFIMIIMVTILLVASLIVGQN